MAVQDPARTTGINSNVTAIRRSPWRHRYQTAGAPAIARRRGVSGAGSMITSASAARPHQPPNIARRVVAAVEGPSLFRATRSNTRRRAITNTITAHGTCLLYTSDAADE